MQVGQDMCPLQSPQGKYSIWKNRPKSDYNVRKKLKCLCSGAQKHAGTTNPCHHLCNPSHYSHLNIASSISHMITRLRQDAIHHFHVLNQPGITPIQHNTVCTGVRHIGHIQILLWESLSITTFWLVVCFVAMGYTISMQQGGIYHGGRAGGRNGRW